ncbi:MAG: alginate export family protein [Rubripirellula sp.]
MRSRLWPHALSIAMGITLMVTLIRLDSRIAHAIEPVVIEDITFDPDSDTESSPSDLAIPYYAPVERIATRLAEPQSVTSKPPSIIEVPPSLRPACQCNNACDCLQIRRADSAMRSAYRCLFFENDFQYLNDPCYRGARYPGDCLKRISRQRVSLGGEARIRFQDDSNIAGSGLTGDSDDYWLTRVRLFADYRVNDWFRLYGEYLHGGSTAEILPTNPGGPSIDRLQNGFFDTQLTETLSVRVGRQEQCYGSQRLVSPLDWVNDRRTFDGFKIIHEGHQWKTDAFFLHPVGELHSGQNSNQTDQKVTFYGIYAAQRPTDNLKIDAYYLGLNNRREQYDYQTVGTRLKGETDAGKLFAFEGAYQFGNNSPGYGHHNAGFMTAGMGQRLRHLHPNKQGNSRLWLWYDWASGDNEIPAVRGDGGFDALFPQSHWYLGFMDLFGRRNINDVSLRFTTPILSPKVELTLWYHYFFLDQKTTPYNADMTAFNPNNAAADRELGQELDLLINFAVNPRNNLLLGYSIFQPGKYYELTPGIPSDADGQFLYLQYQTRF